MDPLDTRNKSHTAQNENRRGANVDMGMSDRDTQFFLRTVANPSSSMNSGEDLELADLLDSDDEILSSRTNQKNEHGSNPRQGTQENIDKVSGESTVTNLSSDRISGKIGSQQGDGNLVTSGGEISGRQSVQRNDHGSNPQQGIQEARVTVSGRSTAANLGIGQVFAKSDYHAGGGNSATSEGDISGTKEVQRNDHGSIHQQGIQGDVAGVLAQSTVANLSSAQVSAETGSGENGGRLSNRVLGAAFEGEGKVKLKGISSSSPGVKRGRRCIGAKDRQASHQVE
jgi:hypothetical protein